MAFGSSPACSFGAESPFDTGSEYEPSLIDTDSSDDENERRRPDKTFKMGAINVTPSFAQNRKQKQRDRTVTLTPKTPTQTPTTPIIPRSESSLRSGFSKLQVSPLERILLAKVDLLQKQNELILRKLDEVLEGQSTKANCATPRISKSKLINVPAEVKSAVHDGFKCGREAKDLTWVIKDASNNTLKYNSSPNIEMSDHINFVKGVYPSTEKGVIKVAIERYFESVKQREYKKRTGKTDLHKQKMMHYSRKKRKMTSRINALHAKNGYSEEKKARVKEALRMELMSSEEENQSDDETCFLVKTIPWRSEECSSIIDELDKKANSSQTPKSKRLYVKRLKGTLATTRPKPSLPAGLQWALK